MIPQYVVVAFALLTVQHLIKEIGSYKNEKNQQINNRILAK
jgi:hypothetical protein